MKPWSNRFSCNIVTEEAVEITAVIGTPGMPNQAVITSSPATNIAAEIDHRCSPSLDS
jgi:hypothetical protein